MMTSQQGLRAKKRNAAGSKKLPFPVCAVYLEYGRGARRSALPLLDEIVGAVPGTSRTLVVVDNSGEAAPLEGVGGFDDHIVLAGTNARREFSGWDEGIAAAWRRLGGTRMTLVLANDTLARHRRFTVMRKHCFQQAFRRAATVKGAVLCGEVDGLPSIMETPVGRVGLYVSTYLALLNVNAVEIGLPLLAAAGKIDAALRPVWDARHPAVLADEVPPGYRDFLAQWLHEAEGGWYAAAPLSEDNFDALRAKAMSIMFEHSLSARITAAGGRIESIWNPHLGLRVRAFELIERRWRLPQKVRANVLSLRWLRGFNRLRANRREP